MLCDFCKQACGQQRFPGCSVVCFDCLSKAKCSNCGDTLSDLVQKEQRLLCINCYRLCIDPPEDNCWWDEHFLCWKRVEENSLEEEEETTEDLRHSGTQEEEQSCKPCLLCCNCRPCNRYIEDNNLALLLGTRTSVNTHEAFCQWVEENKGKLWSLSNKNNVEDITTALCYIGCPKKTGSKCNKQQQLHRLQIAYHWLSTG